MRKLFFIGFIIFVGCFQAKVKHDKELLFRIIEDIRVGWENGDGTPFRDHFLDWDGARYFEGGGQNIGLEDLIINHVEPEAELGLKLGFTNIQTHFEGNFAWAVVDTEIKWN